MNMLGHRNHVFFFYVGENKYPSMFIVHVGNIFSGFFFKAKKKPTHVSRHEWNFLIKFVEYVNHHTCRMNKLGFFPIPKLGLKALY